tara:strand:+ start:13 stop:531 length:519 start_codon:yes stop_codon:yes gene_type:complete
MAITKIQSESVNLADDFAFTGTVSGAGGTNTPACSVYLSGSQNISNNTWTKITFDSEIYDTNNAFASNKFTVPSGQSGTYNFNTRIKISGIDDTEFIDSVLYKNGSAVWNTAKKEYNGGQTDQQIASIVTNQFVLNAGDYIEFYAMHNEGSTRPALGGATDGTWMHIYKLIT